MSRSLAQDSTFNGLVGIFTDSDPTNTPQDFMTSFDWGDQTPPGAGEVIEGTSGIFQVIGWHTYAARGTYPVTISVEDPSGQVVTSAPGSPGTASVTVAPPSLVASSLVATLGTEFDGIVATVTDADPSLPASDYSALIAWGDGTPETAGTVTGAQGDFVVTAIDPTTGSRHTYTRSGEFSFQVTVVDDGGTSVNPSTLHSPAQAIATGKSDVGPAETNTIVSSMATVTAVPIVLTGQFDRSSDSGESNTEGITSDNQPGFSGSSKPFSTVSLFAQLTAGGPPIPLGSTQANGAGAWTMNANVIPDGSYWITIHAVDFYGFEIATTLVMPNAEEGPLVIDTAAPRIMTVSLKRALANVVVTFQDDGSGMNLATIDNLADYSVVRLSDRPGMLVVTGIQAAGSGMPGDPETITLSIAGRKPLSGRGTFWLIVNDEPADVARNVLDGALFEVSKSSNGPSAKRVLTQVHKGLARA